MRLICCICNIVLVFCLYPMCSIYAKHVSKINSYSVFDVYDTAITRGQYLALSKA